MDCNKCHKSFNIDHLNQIGLCEDCVKFNIELSRINRTLNQCWYCCSNPYEDNFNISEMCNVCIEHKYKINKKDIEDGINTDQCYCCGNFDYEALMNCSFCGRRRCGYCGGRDKFDIISCMSCHNPEYHSTTKSGRMKNCCIHFIKANKIEYNFK